ncbi:Armadillo-like helical [Corchorus olitorius]|uniref:Armadillo-like helical n=1 Tax=Corchorus olitorius TaxID=93759 RepID=A0A1R3H2V1_9ROSI|nr:Armadillo-like helical [Corchorus olitorius]
MESMQPFLNAIVKPELLKHPDKDAKLLVATCICEITRITAPEAPYSDDVLKDVTPAVRKLAMNVIEQCSGKLEAGIKQFLISLMSGDNQLVNSEIDYHEVIYDVYRCAPQILSGVAPYLIGELLTDQLDTRLRAVRLVGDLFALTGSTICEAFQPIFSEFLKRLTDRNVGVRMSVLEHVKSCLLLDSSRPEAPQIISALCDRLLDYDENVRKQVVAVICDVACHSLVSVPVEAVKLVAERLRDKSLLVKKYTMERLAEIFRVYCASGSDGSTDTNEFDWIPGKILRGFPVGLQVTARDAEDSEAPELQKKVLFGFRIMSRSFFDPVKAEESFQILDQLKDANIWKILMNLLDPNTTFQQASSGRDDLLKILGEKHRLYDFLSWWYYPGTTCGVVERLVDMLEEKMHLPAVFGVKTLVKSYLPVKDAHLRPGIDDLLGLLKNILMFGEVSEDIESSSVDKAHLRLAAAKAVLRLSRNWDHKIPLDIFHLTLRIPEEKQNLADIFQMYQQAKARQVAIQSDTNSSTAYPEYILPYLVHALAHHSCPNPDECKDVKAFELIYRQLYLIISMLVNKDEDTKSEAGASKEKESISVIFSIFRTIKHSEDIVDATKSKNSHAICDLGLSIMKRLAYKEEDLQGQIQSFSLPPVLYKPYEKKEGEDLLAGEGQTWLADENVLSHFDSLKLECDGTVQTETHEDEALQDSDIDGNEVPLRKMIKQLKSKGAKDVRAKKNKSPSAAAKDVENDVDILKMVREINLDNLGMPSKFESSNGHKHSPAKKTKVEQEHQKAKKRKMSAAASSPVPKRRRSSSAHSGFKISISASKAPSRDSGDDWHQVKDSSFQSTEMDIDELNDSNDKIPGHQLLNENTEVDYLVSSIRKKRSTSSKGKGKGYDWPHSDVANEDEADGENLEKSETTRSSKKPKRRSISGLAKVLYDDGDVEVLRLERERWELVDPGRKSGKKANSLKGSKGPPKEEASPGQKSKSSGGSRQNKSSVKIVKGKRTPKKNLKQSQKSELKSNYSKADDNEENIDVSKSRPTAGNRNHKMNSGANTEMVDENLTDREGSEKEGDSVSHGRDSEDTKGSPNHAEESHEVKSDADGNLSEDIDSISGDAQKEDNKEEKSESEEKVDESSDGEREDTSKATESEAKETEENDDIESESPILKKSRKGSLLPSDTVDSEISDDEPLVITPSLVFTHP